MRTLSASALVLVLASSAACGSSDAGAGGAGPGSGGDASTATGHPASSGTSSQGGANPTSTTRASTGTSSAQGGASASGGGSATGGGGAGPSSATTSTATSTSTASASGGGGAGATTSASTGGGGQGACTVTSASGHIYYVDQGASNASDNNAGTKSAPWKTIQNAGNVVQSGNTVVVEPGTYAGVIFGWDDPNQGPYSRLVGTAASRIVFEADPAAPEGSVIINSGSAHANIAFDLEPGCHFVDLVGFRIENSGTVTKAGVKVSGSTGNRILGLTVDGVGGIGGIFVDAVSKVLIQGNTVLHTMGTGTTGHGMYLSGSSDQVTVLHNLIHDNAYVGIHVNGDISEGGIGVVTNSTIEGNIIHDNGQNGINADGLQGTTIVNNLIYANARNGIELYQIDALGGSSGNFIVNNSIDQSNHGVAIEIAECQYDNQGSAPTPPGCRAAPFDTSTGNVAFDSVLIGAAGPSNVVTAADLSTSTNLMSAAPSPFVNAAGGDYTLAASAQGAGIASFGGATAPLDGGANDIGAFDFGLVRICP